MNKPFRNQICIDRNETLTVVFRNVNGDEIGTLEISNENEPVVEASKDVRLFKKVIATNREEVGAPAKNDTPNVMQPKKSG